jgi:gluconolactonase
MLTDWFEALDPRFASLVLPNVHVDALWACGRWLEGPCYIPAARCLLFSDIPNDRVMRWDEPTGAVTVFQSPAGHQNGRTLDRAGRVVACEHGGRRVIRTEPDGSLTVIADSYDGAPLNSPNDVVVRCDGSVWFTDPTYGIDSDYEGVAAPSRQSGRHVYRADPDTGAVVVVAADFVQPNGLAFSPDEQTLYVADSGASHHPDGPRHIRAFAVSPDGRSLSGGAVLATAQAGVYDGFRLDRSGNLWAGAQDGVHCLSPQGDLLGRIRLPETASNVCFGGPRRNRLFITATRTLYAVYLQTSGLN